MVQSIPNLNETLALTVKMPSSLHLYGYFCFTVGFKQPLKLNQVKRITDDEDLSEEGKFDLRAELDLTLKDA